MTVKYRIIIVFKKQFESPLAMSPIASKFTPVIIPCIYTYIYLTMNTQLEFTE